MLVRIFIALILMTQPGGAAVQAAHHSTLHHDAQVRIDPARGTLESNDIVTLTDRGRIALALDAAIVVDRVSVDGVAQTPLRHGDTLTIDLGPMGTHRIALHETARISTRYGTSSVTLDGGVITGAWLAQPVGVPRTARVSYRITVTTPPGQIAVMDGRLERESHSADGYTATFTSTATNAPVLFTGPYRVAEKIANGVRIRTYFHQELAPLAKTYLDDAAKYISYYSKKIGPYPYTGFAIVSGNDPVGWGLPALTYINRHVLALPFIRTSSLPHEILHSWWGNAVGVDYATGNWAEGLTAYQADLAWAAVKDRDNGRKKRLTWLRDYTALPQVRDFPLRAFTSKSDDASQVVGYGKAAFVFHMLKVRLGTDVFNRALALFFANNLHRRASWADVRTAFETVSGKNLGAFFETWLNRRGAPQLVLKAARAKGRTVTFTLRQVQNGKAYALRIPIILQSTAGERRILIAMNKKTQTFSVSTDATARGLRIDPDFDVFRRLDPVETPPILRDVTLNRTTVLFNATTDQTMRNLAHTLARRLMHREVREVAALPPSGPLIVAGRPKDVFAQLKRMGLTSLREQLRTVAPAKAFAVKLNGRTVLAVMARTPAALSVLARALTHYKERSFVMTNTQRVTAQGTWPINSAPLTAYFK